MNDSSYVGLAFMESRAAAARVRRTGVTSPCYTSGHILG